MHWPPGHSANISCPQLCTCSIKRFHFPLNLSNRHHLPARYILGVHPQSELHRDNKVVGTEVASLRRQHQHWVQGLCRVESDAAVALTLPRMLCMPVALETLLQQLGEAGLELGEIADWIIWGTDHSPHEMNCCVNFFTHDGDWHSPTCNSF